MIYSNDWKCTYRLPSPMIYADYNATTPVSPAVAAAMQPYLAEQFGNPSAVGNQLGAKARTAIEDARAKLATFIDCHPSEIVFVSGGTESCAHALLGALRGSESAKSQAFSGSQAISSSLAFSSIEHPAVLETAAFARDCMQTTPLSIPVDRNGELDCQRLVEFCRTDPGLLVSLMLANNETGICFPIQELSQELHQLGARLHTDAVQAVGKLRVSFAELGVDFLSLSAHKFGGPKGVGALVIRRGARWEPVVKGGGQEDGRRGGTEAVALIVGLGVAAELRHRELLANGSERLQALRDQFEAELLRRVPNCVVTGASAIRLPNTSSVRIEGINSQDLVTSLARQNVIISAGSACSSSGHKPSRVLTEMGFSAVECISTIRVSFGTGSSEAEAIQLAELIAAETALQRQLVARELSQLLKPSKD